MSNWLSTGGGPRLAQAGLVIILEAARHEIILKAMRLKHSDPFADDGCTFTVSSSQVTAQPI